MKIKFIEHKIGQQIFIVPSWEEMGEAVFLLCKEILKSDKSYDWIISIAKGGWTWARTLADYLDMDNLASVKVKSYTDINKNDLFSLEQELPQTVDIKGKKLLVFDDVADSGKTFEITKNYLVGKKPESLTFASLFYKPFSILKPDHFVCETKAWIVFPHEIREFINLAKIQWEKEGINKQEIIKRFLRLGLDKNQVNFLVSLLASKSLKRV